MYLLDINVVSELRGPKPHGAVVAWLMAIDAADLYELVVTVGEIQAGVELTRDQDAEKAELIESWLDRVTETYSVLTIDAATFRTWARLMHRRSDTLYEDAMIAATARVHNLTVVTRNVGDFAPFDVRVLNPFESTAR